MASIVLRNFGGMAPSANPKSLPESAATFVRNLDLRFGDFRPLPVPANIGTAAAGATLYKMEGAANFITRPGHVNFVRGPIPNDATERTYYTGDGAPKVTDLSGSVRQLGVPQPAAAPVVTPIIGAQFSESDANAARMRSMAEFTNYTRSNMSTPHYGLTAADLGARFVTGIWGYPEIARLKIPGAMQGDTFVPTNPAHKNLNDMRLGFRLESEGGFINAYSTITVSAQGLKIEPTLESVLRGLLHPITNAPLLSADMATGVVSTVVEAIQPADKNRDECIARMRTLLADYLEVADKGDPGGPAVRGEVEAFYNLPEIRGEVNAGITRAVSAILSAMQGYTGGDGSPIPITGRPGAPDTYENIQ